ncbi:STAS domain-containing protein [Pseudenhygromyxa sp. WMMC2535]|uniref:STAS domain-containing protein n=1 Tax=Pseudenhygromyxa sp. WMMC2535 TaxID=2712867 RepID=UPI001C3E0757|nr:STAS domain-containing protein [Pseudenhygromyxa sp. WMMC2535]
MAVLDAQRRETIAAQLSERLSGRRASAFMKAGAARCRGLVEDTLAAFEQDLEAGSRGQTRTCVIAMLDGLMGDGLNFADLRFFSTSLREQVRDAVIAGASASADPDAQIESLLAVEDWFFNHLSTCCIHFMVRRDQQLQAASASRDLERFESQLEELGIALAEKTELLERFRQASTPIVPVVSGILVVPLIGAFDQFRAQLLTEKLLDEIVRMRARSVIIDLSGVPLFDVESADMVARLARSSRMLGAEVFFVGLSPQHALAILDLDVDLSGITTLGTLQDGLAQALLSQRLKISKM